MSIKISKDEARLFAGALETVKYEFANNIGIHKKEECIRRINALESLVKKLEKAGDDNRRYGRASHNEFSDLLKRIVNKYAIKKHEE